MRLFNTLNHTLKVKNHMNHIIIELNEHVFTGDMVSPIGKWFMDHIHKLNLLFSTLRISHV